MTIDYLKVSKATDLSGFDKKLYRFFEIIPGLLSWGTLIILIIFSYFKPIWVAYFIIAFDVYWLLLVFYLGVHLLSSYKKLKDNLKINWKEKCEKLSAAELKGEIRDWKEVIHLIILPTFNESADVIKSCFNGLVEDGYPMDKMIVVLAIEERAGTDAVKRAEIIKNEYGDGFGNFIITVHPDGIIGELKGKGANQAWAAKQVKKEIIDPHKIDYKRILVSVFDIDTVVHPGYFHCLTYKFLTVEDPYHASYQPIPVYHNNIWQAPFFARVAASSNTFWQMMQQIRMEKLATYSSHSMTWKALVDINFWSTSMVSEDSRIFWHCLLFYQGNYRVEPLYYPVSMDVCMDETIKQTTVNLYKQQRRWGWGVENVPYLLFNTLKNWKNISKSKTIGRIINQIYGFHSWATNALIIAFVGWLPLIIGGDFFNTTVLSGNLPSITRQLMTIAMAGLILSAIISTLLLPPKPKKYGAGKYFAMFFQWIILPISIIVFGAFPALDSQTRLMLGKYMGFWVTPKKR